MKKILLLILVSLTCVSFSALAQISTGSNSAKVIRTGNRASAGDYGLYFGATSNVIKMAFNDNVEVTFLPLVNFKYMQTDNLELRVGIELNRSSTAFKGEEATSEDEIKYKEVDAAHTIYPGFAYHFSKNNILDVYVGAELPLGYTKYKYSESENNGKDYRNANTLSYQVGLGGFIGLQAYVANLPLAVGVEYGISSIFDLNQKTKAVFKTEGNEEQVTYITPLDGGNYNSISTARTGDIGSQFRFTITYFFK